MYAFLIRDLTIYIRKGRGSDIWVRQFMSFRKRFGSCCSSAYVIFARSVFSPKDDNLGELMSTVCGRACDGGQVWVHARRRGLGNPAGPAGGRLGVDWCSFVCHAAKASKIDQWFIFVGLLAMFPYFWPAYARRAGF